MALFVALIFQVLFVFFAMIINVGLLVHDKINLQNSVDLAAYYAAQRQAEMLNAVAHYNYQIRQAWKLLTFRYRVLSDLGYQNHPIQLAGDDFDDTPAYSDNSRPPNVCINHAFWGFNQNLCYKTKVSIPEIPKMNVVNVLFPVNFMWQGAFDQLRDNANLDCKRTSHLNFNILIKWLLAYRAQIGQAKEALRRYADALSSDTGNFIDIRGESVFSGAEKTFRQNLTRTNLEGEVEGSFRIYNSLGQGQRKAWLNEVLLMPRLLYAYTKVPSGGGGCEGIAAPIDGQTQDPPGGVPPGVTVNEAIEFARKESNIEDYKYHSSFGYEKNPWMMAYVGVIAQSKPRKPFLPFGKPIVITARAFAKPFGGRVGPWFFKSWPRGTQHSAGNFSTQVDPVAPSSYDPDSNEYSDGDNIFPNYSRFPGDSIGLRSKASMAVLKKGLTNYFKMSLTAGPTAVTPMSPFFYEGTPVGGDGLAQLPVSAASSANTLLLGYNGPWIRDFEAAAIAPDLFDATYYSVDPDAYANYILPAKNSILKNISLPLDLGSLGEQFPVGIKKQIEVLNQLKSANSSMNFYLINDWKRLLTGWVPAGAYDYDFPSGVFADCQKEANLPVPGACAAGGRVGYSVKLISRDYLTSDQLVLGGDGQTGPILNPPPF